MCPHFRVLVRAPRATPSRQRIASTKPTPASLFLRRCALARLLEARHALLRDTPHTLLKTILLFINYITSVGQECVCVTASGPEMSTFSDIFRIKHVSYKGKWVPILMQNLNGPCPLLAISEFPDTSHSNGRRRLRVNRNEQHACSCCPAIAEQYTSLVINENIA